MFHRQDASFGNVVKPSDKALSVVKEQTLYPAEVPLLLRQRFQGKTVAEIADALGVLPEVVERLLAGQWRPSKEIRKKLGLTTVYAVL